MLHNEHPTQTLLYFTIILKMPPLFPKQIINFDSKRGGITIVSENGVTQTSYLLIRDADVSDSGRYSCEPTNAEASTIRVHVLNGKYSFFIPYKNHIFYYSSLQFSHLMRYL